MKKRRSLGHISFYHAIQQHASGTVGEGVTQADIDALNHGSQINSGSVYITDPNSRLYLRGTDAEGNLRTFYIDITRGLTSVIPTGSV